MMSRSLSFLLPLLLLCAAARAEDAAAAAPAPTPTPAPLVLETTAEGRVVVPCTLDEVLYTAFLNNATLEIARLDPEIAETAVKEAKGVFDPALAASISARTSNSPQTVVNTVSLNTPTGLGDIADSLVTLDRVLTTLQGPQETVLTSRATDTSLGLSQAFTTGTQLSLNGSVSGLDTDLSDDDYQADLNLALRQPLLRGFGRRIGTITIRQAQNQVNQSLEGFRATLLSTMRQVEQAYWDLVLARELLGIREFGVTLAQEQLERSTVRLQVGKGLQADVLAAQAELATREADLSDAKADIHARTVTLLQLIKPEGRGAWRCDLAPEEAPTLPDLSLDEEASVAAALQKRPEIRQADLEIDRQDLDVRLRKNELLPDLDLVASYGRTGNDNSFGGATNGFGSSRFDNYSVGVEFQTSLSKRSEKARLQRARLNRDQATRDLRRTEDAVEAEVRQAVIAAQKLLNRVGADQKAVAARKEELTIEQGRNQAGKTTTLDVLQVQRDLLQAQTNEATDRVGYLRALAGLFAAEGTLLERRNIVLAEETGAD